MKYLEIACFDEHSALKAVQSDADRIEFCDDLNAGGTTPNLEIFKGLKKISKIPIYIMIRPRGGNFVYSKDEIQQMKNSLTEFKNAGADGFVFGLLNKDNTIDESSCKELIDLAGDKPCSFHRAIDHTDNYFKSLQKIIGLGFSTVLTSGDTKDAESGIHNLKTAQTKFGSNIDIMPGGGIRSSNLKNIANKSNCKWFHSSAITENSTVSLKEIETLKNILKNL